MNAKKSGHLSVGNTEFDNRARLVLLWLFILLGTSILQPLYAQSAVGEIFGQVVGEKAAKVRVENLQSGLTRDTVVDSKGGYTFTALPTGTYKVSLEKDGKEVSAQQIEVQPGTGTPANFSGVTELQEVKVVANGVSKIDVSTAETSVTFSAKQLQQIPVPRGVVDVALLTPGTSAGSPAFGNLPSFGGSSVAENSYYINGFEVTNLFDNLSYSQVPFEGIADEQVLTGGYGPEYGRSTGGVINVVTKRGTNQFEGGASAYWEPNSLRSGYDNVHFKDGREAQNFDDYSLSKTTAAAWLGGPIIKTICFSMPWLKRAGLALIRTPIHQINRVVADPWVLRVLMSVTRSCWEKLIGTLTIAISLRSLESKTQENSTITTLPAPTRVHQVMEQAAVPIRMIFSSNVVGLSTLESTPATLPIT